MPVQSRAARLSRLLAEEGLSPCMEDHPTRIRITTEVPDHRDREAWTRFLDLLATADSFGQSSSPRRTAWADFYKYSDATGPTP